MTQSFFTVLTCLLAFVSSSTDAFVPAASTSSRCGVTSLTMGLKVGDSFPKEALKKWGVAGKNSVVYFYGADDAPSCKKENALFDAKADEFRAVGTAVVGVRNEAGVKETEGSVRQKLVVDEDDSVRKQIGIVKDFGLLGGRETYVLNKKGEVEFVFNSQFKPEQHVIKSLNYVEENTKSPKKGAFSFFN